MNDVLPGLIKEHSKFGVNSNHPAIIWKLNLDKLNCSTPGRLMVGIIQEMNDLAEELHLKLPDRSTIRKNSADYKNLLGRSSDGGDYLMDLLKGLEALTAELEHPLFILIDEVQRFFFWPEKDGGLDKDKVKTMRWVYKNLVTFGEREPPKVRFAVTGSCMMAALMNIYQCPVNGTNITLHQLDLPCSVPTVALDALCDSLPSPLLEKEIKNFCSRSPALMIHLMQKFFVRKKATACIDPVSKFCFGEIEMKIATELRVEVFPLLQDLDRNGRLLLRSLGLDSQGVPRSALSNRYDFKGLYEHLEPFLRPIQTVSLEVDEAEGESASTPEEEHVYVAYVPFQAFVTSAISSSGVLAESQETCKNDLYYHLFRSVMLDFGERLNNEIGAGTANSGDSPLNNPLDDIVKQCKNAGLSLDDLKTCSLCDYIEGLEECVLRKVGGGISKKYSLLKNHLPKRLNHRDACRSIFVALRNVLIHTATEEEKLKKLLPLLPFTFFKTLSLIRIGCEDAKALERVQLAREEEERARLAREEEERARQKDDENGSVEVKEEGRKKKRVAKPAKKQNRPEKQGEGGSVEKTAATNAGTTPTRVEPDGKDAFTQETTPTRVEAPTRVKADGKEDFAQETTPTRVEEQRERDG